MTKIIPGEHEHSHQHHDESKDLLPILKMEVLGHLPFTIMGMIFGLILVWVGTFWIKMILTEEVFHFTHFLHIFFSGAAAAALMTYYEVSYARSIIMGMLSSIILCTLSDTVIPYWGAQMMGKDPSFHLCALEHPQWVLLMALLGTNIGLIWLKGFEHCSRWSHLFHIFISSAASGIYLFSFSHTFLAQEIVGVLLILFIAIFI
ncbi:MAG: hypothetical protein HZC17_02940, partial [Candidatus Omnitrophica bacterium]|nr:hypothetical protein [Candidatus Omnitrophota bacterium]